jgi:glycosyltransferase involved in cell wall biosynthesis
MVKISVIVPVYNVENYIDECITSICVSSIKDIEILLIDDGSTDSSGKKCEEWAKKDSRIKVYHKLNGGLSDARNYGLQFAKGEFIGFVDSDDKIAPDMLEKLLLACIRDETKVAIGGVFLWNPDLNKEKRINDLPTTGVYQIDFYKYSSIYCNTAWRKLYHRSLFDEKTLFPKGIIHEDIGLWWIVMSKISKISVVNEALYYYRQNNQNSICADKNTMRHLSDAILSYAYGLQIGMHNIDCRYKEQYLADFAQQYLRNTSTSLISQDAVQANNFVLRKIKGYVRGEELSDLYFKHQEPTFKLLSIKLFPCAKKQVYFRIRVLSIVIIEFTLGQAQ